MAMVFLAMLVSACQAMATELIDKPDAAALVEAEKQVSAAYSALISAAVKEGTGPELAEKMIEAAAKTENPALQYAMLDAANNLAIKAEDSAVAVRAMRKIVSAYRLGNETLKQCLAKGHAAMRAGDNQRTFQAALQKRLEAAFWYLRAELLLPDEDLDARTSLRLIVREIELGENMPITPDRNELVVFNTHNFKYGSGGSSKMDVHLLLHGKAVWQKKDVALRWDRRKT